MRTSTYKINQVGWLDIPDKSLDSADTLVLMMAANLCDTCIRTVTQTFPTSHIVALTASEVYATTSKLENTAIVSVIKFEKSHFKIDIREVDSENLIFETKAISRTYQEQGMDKVLVVSKNKDISHTIMLNCLHQKKRIIFGMIPHERDLIDSGFVYHTRTLRQNEILFIGFSSSVTFSSVCINGWRPFGLEKQITKISEREIVEIDGMPAIELYKKYLGKLTTEILENLQAYPIRISSSGTYVNRRVTGVSEQGGLYVAEEVPAYSLVRLLISNSDYLIDHLESTIRFASIKQGSFVLINSGAGRKAVLGDLHEDELVDVYNGLNRKTQFVGLRTQGEMSTLNMLLDDTPYFNNECLTLLAINEDADA
jgi:hypothetical protein